MSISLCIIVKNNQDTIQNCLESAKDIADEIIIVNTGSNDNTFEIANKYTAKIFNFQWNNNFSEAKNFAISKASSDWILALDADETISSNDLKKIKQLTEEYKDNVKIIGISLLQRNYTNELGLFNLQSTKYDDYEESSIATSFFTTKMIRLFRNDKRIKFEGIVHDSVENSIKKIGKILETEIPIHHYGYLNRNSERVKLYIDLEKANIKNDFFQYYQLASQLNLINNLEEAELYAKKSLELNPIFGLSYLELGIINIKKKNLEQAKFNLEKAEEHLNHPMLFNYLGILHGMLNDFEKSESYLKQAISILPTNADFHYNLALTYNKSNQEYKAQEEMLKAIDLNPAYKKFVEFLDN